ncbi:response regulator transcription factor [Streptomyces sp. NPDC002143]
MHLTGRFAAEAINRPDSDLARFACGQTLGRSHGLRLLLPQTDMPGPETRARLTRLTAEGTQIRVSSGSLPNLALLAREVALVETAAGQDGRPQIVVVRREATDALYQFQQTLWEHAAELMQPRRGARPVRLDEAQTQVLRMLGSGMKDDTAARQMNVSVRTYRRHVAAILKTLGVNTRFEAGLKAAELGLLTQRRVPSQGTGPGAGAAAGPAAGSSGGPVGGPGVGASNGPGGGSGCGPGGRTGGGTVRGAVGGAVGGTGGRSSGGPGGRSVDGSDGRSGGRSGGRFLPTLLTEDAC